MPSPKNGPSKKRRLLTADKKFQIYLEAQDPTIPVGEILRREGLFSTDLARIRQQVKEGALLRLSVKPGRAKEQPNVSAEAYPKFLKIALAVLFFAVFSVAKNLKSFKINLVIFRKAKCSA